MLAVLIGIFATPVLAVEDAPPLLETVLVTGTLPGPSLWRVRHDEHTLWILGTISPLPRDMVWKTTELEALIAESGEVLAPGGVDAKLSAADTFKIATLARSAFAATRNRDGKVLREVLPAPLYGRWSAMKADYLEDDNSFERSRPLFASQDLYYGAITASGLTRADVVWKRVAELAEDRGVPVTRTRIERPLALDRKRYKAGISSLTESKVDDIPCFTATLDTLPAKLETMRQGANAWATGDLDRLRELGHATLQPACRPLYDQAMGFQNRPDDDALASAAWLDAAEAALLRHRVSIAVLPMAEVLSERGLVAQLAARGHRVIAPDAEDETSGP